MSETTSFNPSDEYINALLCKVNCAEGSLKSVFILSAATLKK